MTTPVKVAVGTIPTLVGTVPAGGQIYMRVEGTQPVTVSNAANASSNLVVGGGTVLAAPTAPGNGGSTTQVYTPSTGGADTTEWYAIAPSASVLLVEVSAVPSGGGAGITGESLQFGLGWHPRHPGHDLAVACLRPGLWQHRALSTTTHRRAAWPE